MKALALLLAYITTLAVAGDVAAKRLERFVDAFNSKDRAKVQAMVNAEFDPAMFKSRNAEAWTNQTLAIAENLAPIKVVKKVLETPTSVVATIESGKGEKLAIRIDCSPQDPNKIIGVRLDESVDNLLDRKPSKDYSAYTSLDDLAQMVLSDSKVPAIAIATIANGKLHSTVKGVRKQGESDPATLADRWLIGSNAKSMTSVLIATLIEEGKLRWDSTLGELLPDIAMKDAYKTVTVEQLMQHMAGVPKDMTFTGADVVKIVGDLKDPVAIRAAYAKDVLNRDPVGKPGEKFAYSNAGYSILGHIAERIAKKPFPELLTERVFKPLGLSTAMVGAPGDDGMPSGKNQPHGHFKIPSGLTPGKLTGPLNHMMNPAGGGVAISIEDMARYVEWHMKGLAGEKIALLKPETVKRLHTPLPRPEGMEKYAAGWLFKEEAGAISHTHMGSDGSMVALMSFFPKEKLVVVAIVNAGLEPPTIDVVKAVAKHDIRKG
jgi:CubicO group peptidase (beta-lactamase class C family)